MNRYRLRLYGIVRCVAIHSSFRSLASDNGTRMTRIDRMSVDQIRENLPDPRYPLAILRI